MSVCFALLMDTISAHTSVRAEPIASSGGDTAIKERKEMRGTYSGLINKNTSNAYKRDSGGGKMKIIMVIITSTVMRLCLSDRKKTVEKSGFELESGFGRIPKSPNHCS